jgi:hypothetical protein
VPAEPLPGEGFRLRGHGRQDNRLQIARHRRIELPQASRVAVDDQVDQLVSVFARKRRLQREQLVKRHPQRVNVRSLVQHLPASLGLLRAHVAKGTQHVARHGEIHAGPGLS